MLTLRRSAERGHADHGWLQSFTRFRLPIITTRNMGFGPLRVINDDLIAPGQGFGMHGHRDMEIISYVLEGELAHKDSMGNGSVIRPGDVQRMSAGRGVLHLEFNHAQGVTTHLLQIWIEPNVRGIVPSYEEKRFEVAAKRGRLRLVAAPDGADGSVTIHQDARVYAGLFNGDEAARLPLAPGRRAYVHVARGSLAVNGERLTAGDAAKLEQVDMVELARGEAAEVLVFDLP